jgi:hypothetical protein
MTALTGWENFYVIVGSSAGALIGLQFVVITLIASRRVGAGQAEAGSAFATPSVVHFGTVLLLSSALCAPWRSIEETAVFLGAVGIVGMVYVIIVIRRQRRQTAYKPELEDWMFHAVLPLAAYLTLSASAYATGSNAYEALFGVAGAALLLLFIGIHNAWDAVTYHVFTKSSEK